MQRRQAPNDIYRQFWMCNLTSDDQWCHRVPTQQASPAYGKYHKKTGIWILLASVFPSTLYSRLFSHGVPPLLLFEEIPALLSFLAEKIYYTFTRCRRIFMILEYKNFIPCYEKYHDSAGSCFVMSLMYHS